MSAIGFVIAFVVLIKIIESLNVLQVQNIPAINEQKRAMRQKSLSRARDLYKLLTKNSGNNEAKKSLRSAGTEDVVNLGVREEQAGLIEKELKDALSQQKSALLDNPYVTKQGRNDFLVMNPERNDQFVTVIPNDIYYNIEKKCVNWLDDCSLKGIRARLLSGVQSPYKFLRPNIIIIGLRRPHLTFNFGAVN